MKILTKNIEETYKYGQTLSNKVKSGGLICLSGDLGAGKTTLVQGIAKGLGISRRINSPTFTIVRKYDNFWHIDLYRLKDLAQAQAIGIEEVINDSDNIVVIEWPEVIKDILPQHYIEVKIKILGQDEREFDENIY